MRRLAPTLFVTFCWLGAAHAIPQPPHDAASGVECNDCHVPFGGVNNPAESTGSATVGSGALALNDAGKGWVSNQWRDGVVTFLSGANEGHFRTILTNTGTRLTWEMPLPNALSVGDSYALGKTTYADIETQCRSCHNPTGTAAAMPNIGLHGVGNGEVVGCGKCHEPHNVDPNSGVGNGLVRDALRWPTANALAFPSGGGNPLVAGAPNYNGVCESCHTQTDYHRNDGSADTTHNVGQDCTSCHPHEDGFAATGGCTDCHGGLNNAAPPVSLSGSSNTANVQVGAHQAHLLDGTLRRAVACGECHVVPNDVNAPGHLGAAPAELVFGALSTTNGLAPSWNRGAATCANTWCHGGDPSITGGSNTAPTWTVVNGSQSACGTCHGEPPPAPHSPNPDCKACHPGTMLADNTIDVAGGLHINGVVDAASDCNSCHGSATNDAPPIDLGGGSATTRVGVGAHQAHLAGGAVMGPMACDTCHQVPNDVNDAGHLDAAPAEVTFNALAQADGANPNWNRAGESCANTYCHGATLNAGGTIQTPSWTTVNGSQAACGTCHGAPPPAPHPAGAACNDCHPQTMLANGNVDVAGGFHINGSVESQVGCDSCHGSNGDPAPPVDLSGSSNTSNRGVGAHQAHLNAGTIMGAMACTTCHQVPGALDDPGHTDTAAPAEVQFNALAQADGANPSWNGGTCANTYCHGGTLNAGGTIQTPTWTTVNGSQAACGTCHGAPPPAPHPVGANCNDCHPQTMLANGDVDVAGGFHINGSVESQVGCDSCHGSNGDPAPPVDLSGSSNTSSRGVGAHQAHLNAGTIMGAMACTTCHQVPNALDDPGHTDTAAPAEVQFNALAQADGANPSWNGGTCADTYCHGGTLNAGGTIQTPTWTTVNGTQAACGTCHGSPPPAPHSPDANCVACHPGTVLANNTINVAGGLHINGSVEANSDCNSCHGSGNNDAPPADLTGGVATGLIGVGAHQTHLGGGAVMGPMPCTTCHTVPNDVNDAGHLDAAPADLNFNALAGADGANPSWNRGGATCANTYCHGSTLNAGGSNQTPTWTTVNGSQAACGTCHGEPPPAPHPAGANCNDCHPQTMLASGDVDVAGGFHINGNVESQTACNSCHGSGTNDAPPTSLSGSSNTANVAVGAHQAHLQASDLMGPIACGTCHVVPGSLNAPGHTDTAAPAEVTFNGTAVINGANPTWNRAAATCANTYCHGSTLNAGGTIQTPSWTTVNGSQDACGTCHGDPPPAPHVQNPNCNDCHSGTVQADHVTINVGGGLHINGVLEAAAGNDCLGCHNGAQGPRRQVNGAGGDFVLGAHHVTDGSNNEVVTNEDCQVCHDQANHQAHADPEVLLNDPDGAASHQYDGGGASLEGFCLGCHDGNSSTAFDNSGAAGNQPFSDGDTPANIQSDWAAGAHATSGVAALANEGCLACHGGDDPTRAGASVDRNTHGAAFDWLLSNTIVGTVVGNNEEALCLACHDGNGPASTDIAAELGKSSAHAPSDTNGVHSLLETLTGSRNHVECVDCHDPHAANGSGPGGAGQVPGALRGVAGVNSAGNVVDPATFVYEVCYKCHADSGQPIGGRVPRVLNEASLRADFDPGRTSFHPVEAVGNSDDVPSLINGLTEASRITCGDCHSNNTLAGPAGPHGSAWPWLLERRYETDDPTNLSSEAYDMCFKCHDEGSIMNDDSFREHDKHIRGEDTSCSVCHDPHGSDQTHLINFDTRVVSSNGGTLEWVDEGNQAGSCTLTCHGFDHDNESY